MVDILTRTIIKLTQVSFRHIALNPDSLGLRMPEPLHASGLDWV